MLYEHLILLLPLLRRPSGEEFGSRGELLWIHAYLRRLRGHWARSQPDG